MLIPSWTSGSADLMAATAFLARAKRHALASLVGRLLCLLGIHVQSYGREARVWLGGRHRMSNVNAVIGSEHGPTEGDPGRGSFPHACKS